MSHRSEPKIKDTLLLIIIPLIYIAPYLRNTDSVRRRLKYNSVKTLNGLYLYNCPAYTLNTLNKKYMYKS